MLVLELFACSLFFLCADAEVCKRFMKEYTGSTRVRASKALQDSIALMSIFVGDKLLCSDQWDCAGQYQLLSRYLELGLMVYGKNELREDKWQGRNYELVRTHI